MQDEQNPYQAPESNLNVSESSATLLDSPRSVSIRQGFNWLEKGISHYVMPHFSKWVISCSIYSLIAVVGLWLGVMNILLQFAAPFFTAGVLIGCHKIRQSQEISNHQVFEAFSHPRKVHLFLFCLLQVILIIILVAIVFLSAGLSMADLEKFQQIQSNPEDPQLIIEALKPFLSMIPVILILAIFYSIAAWFAPALIIFDNKAAPMALGTSFIGGIKNILPFLLLFLITILLFGVLGFIIGILGFIFELISPVISEAIATILMGVISLPVLGSAIYVGYRDIFYGDAHN